MYSFLHNLIIYNYVCRHQPYKIVPFWCDRKSLSLFYFTLSMLILLWLHFVWWYLKHIFFGFYFQSIVFIALSWQQQPLLLQSPSNMVINTCLSGSKYVTILFSNGMISSIFLFSTYLCLWISRRMLYYRIKCTFILILVPFTWLCSFTWFQFIISSPFDYYYFSLFFFYVS